MLRQLPAVFSRKDVETSFDMSPVDTTKAIGRWKEKKLAHPVGTKTGYYYNRFRSPERDDIKLALDRIVRLPYLVIGANALRHAGWTDQRGGEIEVAVPVNAAVQSYPQIEGFLLLPRSAGWFDLVWEHSTTRGIHGLRTLDPEYALVDVIMSRLGLTRKDDKAWHKVWRADPDDIHPPGDAVETISRCRTAALEMDAPLDDVRKYLSRIGELSDDIDSFDDAPAAAP